MLFTLGGIGVILVGLIYVFNKKWAWRLQKFQIINWGLEKRERPERWEQDSTVVGIMVIIIGVILVILGLS